MESFLDVQSFLTAKEQESIEKLFFTKDQFKKITRMNITASKLYNYLQCEHRVWRDANGPQEEKSKETNPFVQMLWDKGVGHEEKVVSGLGTVLNLKDGTEEGRIQQTLDAMRREVPLIYQGVVRSGDLLGIPDLLKRNGDGTYLPVDIKSGMGVEGVDEASEEIGKYKKHYAVQLALYSEVLIDVGFAKQHKGMIIDINSDEVIYELDLPMGARSSLTWWDFYLDTKIKASKLINNEVQNTPAYFGMCKLCPWYGSCKKWVTNKQDPTMLFYVGRRARDTLYEDLDIENYKDLRDLDIGGLIEKKKKDKHFLSGLGESSLEKIVRRSKIMGETKTPVIHIPQSFPKTNFELYFDIEDDPTQAFVYLHGVYERSQNGERFVSFVALDKTDEAEKNAWQNFWEYIRSLPKDDFTIYYYSHHEKTTYHRMMRKYPDVVTEEEVDWFFSKEKAVDLYSEVILNNTDWPLMSYSLKEIAQYLGFDWRDKSPSGAMSIQWFNTYLETKDQKDMDRILLYNEDDCKATMVIKDFLDKQQL